MKTNYVLIDYENVQVESLTLLKGECFKVKVFLGPKNTKLPVQLVLTMQEFGDRAEYIVMESHGTNALDFHIAYYLGVLATSDQTGYFHVISKDTGFDPLIRYLKSRKVFCWRSESIEDLPCFSHAKANGTGSEIQTKAVPAKPTGAGIDSMINAVVDDLIKRKSSKPRTVKTLRSTIQAKLGKNIPAAIVESVYAALLSRGNVKADGLKVTYVLPST